MSMYAQFDENGTQEQFATNTGWSQFGDWADEQDVADFPALIQLWEHGHSTSLGDVQAELGRALEGSNLDDDLRGIVQGLHDAVKNNLGAEIVMITNGMRADDGSPEESQLAPGEVVE